MGQQLTRLWGRLLLAFVGTVSLALITLGGVASAHSNPPSSVLPPNHLSPPPDHENLPSLIYARVLTGSVPVYQHPLDPAQGLPPTRLVDSGYVWVTLAAVDPILYDEQVWYAVNANEYIQADYLELYQPSKFRGVVVSTPTTFAWVVFDVYTAAGPGELPGDNTVLLTRYTIVPIEETRLVEDRNWYRVGYNQWVEQGMVAIVTPKSRPEGVGPADKWIEVDLYEQTLAAYEGDQMVYATLVSSGLPWWQTEPGLFQIWIKIKQAKMSGREGYPDYYFLEDVPWTMYFNGGFALHGAYWHDRFGIRHSRGCINLSLADARWLYDWTTPTGETGWILATAENPGTWVWVHE